MEKKLRRESAFPWSTMSARKKDKKNTAAIVDLTLVCIHSNALAPHGGQRPKDKQIFMHKVCPILVRVSTESTKSTQCCTYLYTPIASFTPTVGRNRQLKHASGKRQQRRVCIFPDNSWPTPPCRASSALTAKLKCPQHQRSANLPF